MSSSRTIRPAPMATGPAFCWADSPLPAPARATSTRSTATSSITIRANLCCRWRDGSAFTTTFSWTVGSVVLLLCVVLGTLAWYTTTADFQRRVGNEVVKVLEDATGGRVELKGMVF